MGNLLQDLRFAFRMLTRSPGFTAVAVLSLGLGIGANTTVFSLVNGLLLRPLPVKESDRLVSLYTSDFSGPLFGVSSYPDYTDFRGKNQVFSSLAAHYAMPLSLSGGGETERIWGQIVTGNFFPVLGVPAVVGRTLTPEDDREPGAHPVVVLSHGLWQRRFSANPDVVGSRVLLNGQPFTVVGVAPKDFTGLIRGFAFDAWVPMMMHNQVLGDRDALTERGARWLLVFGRLKREASFEQAQASFNVLARQLYETYPENWRNVRREPRRVTLVWANEALVFHENRGALVSFALLLMGVVGFVLLVACANVANLLLARAAARRKEISIRLSLGAGRWRLLRQLLTESLVLSLLAGLAAVLITLWTTGLLMRFRPPVPFPVALDLTLDGRTLGFTLAASFVTAILFGLLPSLQSSRADLAAEMKAGGGAISGPAQRRFLLRDGLVALQVALSVLLLIGSGLFLRSLGNAASMDAGFDPDHVVVASVDLAIQGYGEAKGKAFHQQLLEHVGGLPGVRSASLAEVIPLGLSHQRTSVSLEGYSSRQGEDMELNYNVVGPGYFDTMSIELKRGRGITGQDREGSPPVAVVNEALARRYWPGQDPIGKHITRMGDKTFEVVGVARDGKYRSLTEEPLPYFYLALWQNYRPAVSLHVRSWAASSSVIASLRGQVRDLNPNLPLFDVKTLDEHLGIALLPARMAATLFGAFGVVALLLAGAGVFGVMSYAVSRRTREVGIRMALGARRSEILGFVLRQGMTAVLAGMIVGLTAALALTRVTAGLLYGVSATDPATFIVVSLLSAATALLAGYLPARRAAKVDPMTALRYE